MESPTPAKTNLPYLIFLGGTAALGGLLFGFDAAIITGAGPFLERHFHLSPLKLGWAFSCLLYGCVAGSAITGWIADKWGRRIPLLWVAVLFTLTSLATGTAQSFTIFVIVRTLGGLAVGGVSILAPMYVSEVSPPGVRGRMGTLYQLSIVMGVLVSYCINYFLRDLGDWNWRWMFISGVVPSVAFFLLVLRAPETPRYLIKAGRPAEALAILARIGGPESAAMASAEIKESLVDRRSAWTELLRPGILRALAVSFVLAILVQASGVNAIVDYAPRIFQSAGWKIDAALLSTFVMGIASFLFTLGAFPIIDRFGRKPCYIVGSLGMTAALAGLAAVAHTGQFTGPRVLVLILVFLVFFTPCIGPVFWTLMPEIFPNRVRGEAMTVPVLTQWLANALVVHLFPWAVATMGNTATFGFLAAMALTQALFTWRFLPETKGRTLEEIEGFWEGRGAETQKPET
jgi:SP family arabinose:H+ symporter-like MFS transporter